MKYEYENLVLLMSFIFIEKLNDVLGELNNENKI